ncbi:hypothetical protein JCM19055_2240 [Geomicrobium sp. JCM 19055]|nr:hypothetical protein JCM19055_2240 [Geomicrobium sp. JCM 19055]
MKVKNDPANPGIDTVLLMADLRFIIQKRSIASLVRDDRKKEDDHVLHDLVETYKSQ